MAYNGFLRLGGSEIINSDRTAAYIASLVPQLGFSNCTSCPDLRYLVNRKPAPEGQITSGAWVEQSSRYNSPLMDQPDWFDPDDEDTWGFAGLYPLRITGLDDDTRSATVVETTHDGGAVLLPRKATREISVTGLLVANSSGSLSAGMRWLRKVLDNVRCDHPAVTSCDGDDLSFFMACPDCVPLDGYDYEGRKVIHTVPGSYGWQANGGTLTPDVGSGLSIYTSGNPGAHYAQYSPYAAVCDEMTFRLNFGPGGTAPALQRTNIVPNPSFRAASGQVAVRTNLCRNPVGKYYTLSWSYQSNLGPSTGGNIEAKGPTSQSPNLQGGLQERFIRYETERTINRSGAGLRASIYDFHYGVPLNISALMKTYLSGATKVQINVTWRDSDGFVLDVSYGAEQNITINQWTRFSQVHTPPIGAEHAYVHFNVASSITGTFVDGDNPIAVSEVVIEEASTAPSWDTPYYFDGDIGYTAPGLSRMWLGTPHYSASALVGASTPNTIYGHTYAQNPAAWSESHSYRSGSDEAQLFLMGASTFGTTAKVMDSSNFTPVPSEFVYAARLRVQHVDGPQAALGAILRLRAYSGANADLGIVATSGDTQYPVGVGATVEVTTAATALLPAGTAYLRAELVWNTAAAIVPTILKLTQFLIEPVDSVGNGPGTFFDGDTPDSSPLQYGWNGTENASSSYVEDDTPVPPDVRLEAWGATPEDPATFVLIDDVEGLRSLGSLTLTLDGEPWKYIAYRLVPLDASAVPIVSHTRTWHVPYGYGTPYDWEPHPLGYYGTTPSMTVDDSPEEPILDMLHHPMMRYYRTLRRVTAVSGPRVTRSFPSRTAHMQEVEFTLVAGVPHIYGQEHSLGTTTLTVEALQTHDPSDPAFVITDFVPPCTSLTSTGPVLDPLCSTIPNPPAVPDILAICGPPESPVLQRYGILIPAESVPEWSEVVPILTYTPSAAVGQIGIKFYPTPTPGMSPSELDPCSMRAGLVINYSDTNGIVIDGANEKVYSPVPEMGLGYGGAVYSTGRIIERSARHLVTNSEYGPFQWPVLSCGVGYLVVVETYQPVSATLDIKLVARQ